MSDAEKKARLAEALRQNLRKRKAQTRGQKDAAPEETAPAPLKSESNAT